MVNTIILRANIIIFHILNKNYYFFFYRLSCLQLLSKGLSDFMVAEPEDLRIFNLVKNLNVTHELKLFSDRKFFTILNLNMFNKF